MPNEALDLRPGELVRVKPKNLIELTLNSQSRNRGLYFDREMIRFCGGEYRVKARLERVIVEKTGELRQLTNPCIILDGVTATGEYQGLNPENEYIFWREVWLERIEPSATRVTDVHRVSSNDGHSTERSEGIRGKVGPRKLRLVRRDTRLIPEADARIAATVPHRIVRGIISEYIGKRLAH